MKWVIKGCPRCGEKMVLITANLYFRPKVKFNLHCEKCDNILKYGNEQFSTEAKLLKNDELVELLALLIKSK